MNHVAFFSNPSPHAKPWARGDVRRHDLEFPNRLTETRPQLSAAKNEDNTSPYNKDVR